MVNNSTNINKEELQPPLNIDGQQFHQYQQNELIPPVNSDGQQFTNINKTNYNHL